MFRLIVRIEKRILSAFDFVLNIYFFWRVLGNPIRRAVEMARNIVPEKS